MTIAYTCILIAALLPYIWVVIAKSGGPRYDNRDPRGWMAKQENPRVHRASAAQFNAFEAFAPFAASVLMAQFAGVDPQRITWLAIAFVMLRVLHGVLYVANNARLRSVAWAGAFGCVFALMVMSVLRIGG
ncbi:MAG: MAPEG family protein [Luteimonas sp.]